MNIWIASIIWVLCGFINFLILIPLCYKIAGEGEQITSNEMLPSFGLGILGSLYLLIVLGFMKISKKYSKNPGSPIEMINRFWNLGEKEE